jgi:hypothetical protein
MKIPVTTAISGEYEFLDQETIVVYYLDKKSEPTKLGTLPPKLLAQQLLGELFRAARPKPQGGVKRVKVLY